MTTSTPDGLVPAPADDPGTLAAVVVGRAVTDVRRAVAQRVGLTGEEPLPVVLATLDKALAERAYAPPEGSELVDSPTLAQLRAEAEAGRNHRTREVLNSAIREGRIRPADRGRWERLLDLDFNAAAATIKSLPVVVPLKALAYTEDRDHDEARDILRDLYGP